MGVAGLATLPEGARRIDPVAEAERLGRERVASSVCIVPLVDEWHLVTANEMPRFVRITLTTEEVFPVSADLGKRIADLIRADQAPEAADE
jgi:hypothetical protein